MEVDPPNLSYLRTPITLQVSTILAETTLSAYLALGSESATSDPMVERRKRGRAKYNPVVDN